MVSVEDTIKTFLECINLTLIDKNEEEKNKIDQILKRSIVDLCYALVPEVDTLVSEKGIFQPTTPERGTVMKAFFNEQRKAFFAILTGITILKIRLESEREHMDKSVAELKQEINTANLRLSSIQRIMNTAIVHTRNTGTAINNKPEK